MKTFLRTHFFWAKVLPTVFFCVLIAGMLYPPSHTVGIILGFLLISVLLLNLYMKKVWISQLLGAVFTLICLYMLFAVLSEYSEFPDGSTYEAMRLLLAGLALCASTMVMGVLMCIPFKRRNNEMVALS